MRVFKTAITVLVALTGTSVGVADIYKCDGPDGPIFTDQVCGPEATTIQHEETSGLGGVYDDAKAEQERNRAQRQAEREAANNLKTNPTVINNQFSTFNTEPAGYWPSRPYSRPPRPEPRPASPPGTLEKRER